MNNIENEIAFYKANRAEFVQQYAGKYLAIKGMKVIGIFDTNSKAEEETCKYHEKGSYIIERPMDLSIARKSIKRR